MPIRKQKRASTDWHEVRTRLAGAINATLATTDLTAEQASVVLRERARVLAKPKASAVPSGEVVEALFLHLGSQPYAIDLRFVHEMRKLGSLCRVPGLPPLFMGLAPHRGEMLVIVDLCLLLEMPASALGGDAHLVVLGNEGPEFAIVAAGVERTAPLSTHDLLEPPEQMKGAGRRLIHGITGDGRVFLDGLALLGDERLFVGRQDGPPQPPNARVAVEER